MKIIFICILLISLLSIQNVNGYTYKSRYFSLDFPRIVKCGKRGGYNCYGFLASCCCKRKSACIVKYGTCKYNQYIAV